MKQMEIGELMHNSETAKLERIIEYWRSQQTVDSNNHKQNFKVYTKELDKRRSTIFSEVFPEYMAWFDAI